MPFNEEFPEVVLEDGIANWDAYADAQLIRMKTSLTDEHGPPGDPYSPDFVTKLDEQIKLRGLTIPTMTANTT